MHIYIYICMKIDHGRPCRPALCIYSEKGALMFGAFLVVYKVVPNMVRVPIVRCVVFFSTFWHVTIRPQKLLSPFSLFVFRTPTEMNGYEMIWGMHLFAFATDRDFYYT